MPILIVNTHRIDIGADVPGDTPLLWVLRDNLNLTGTKYGCGMALCGACTVHVDGQPMRSCLTPLSSIKAGARDHHDRGPEGQERRRPCRRPGRSSTCRNAATASRARSWRRPRCSRRTSKPDRRRHRRRRWPATSAAARPTCASARRSRKRRSTSPDGRFAMNPMRMRPPTPPDGCRPPRVPEGDRRRRCRA